MYIARIYNSTTGKIITSASGDDLKALQDWIKDCTIKDCNCYGIIQKKESIEEVDDD